MIYSALKFLHVIGAAVLLGTGAGIAFFMLLAHLRGEVRLIAGVARIVVIADFVFTAGEQLFFHDKQFKNEPKRCKNCKGKRAQALGLPQNGGNYQRVETKAICSGCQRETTVPFKPTQGRPVFCRECFQQRKTTAATA